MKIAFKIEAGKPYIVIRYDDKEWEKIEGILKGLGLQIRETENGFGLGCKLKFYREENTELLNYMKNTFRDIMAIDNINKPVWDGVINIAVFRVIPNENCEVKIPLQKFLTILEFKEIVESLVRTYRRLFNLITQKEVKVVVEEEGEQK